jgi:hypothetical protein
MAFQWIHPGSKRWCQTSQQQCSKGERG